MRESSPIELAGSVTKSRVYFRHARWKGRRRCPRCGYRLLYHLKDKRFGCKRCDIFRLLAKIMVRTVPTS